MAARRQTVEQQLRALVESEPDFRARYTLEELGAMCGVSRQRIHQVLGRYAGQRKKPRPPAPRPDALPTRLRAFEAAEPRFRDRYTLPELARKFEVSHQWVSKTLGPLRRPPGTVHRYRARETLRDFAQRHPQAVRPLAEGGMRMVEIAEEVGLSVAMLTRIWRDLRLPSRVLPPRERTHVLRRERCVECGRRFAWTVQQEYNFTKGAKRFRVCSARCGQRQGFKRRTADSHLISIMDAASRFELSASQIRRLVEAGTVKGKRAGRYWAVDARSLERYAARRT
jgi:hypothetical protein